MKKKILVVSRGLIHPSFFCRRSLKKVLQELNYSYSFTYTGQLDGLQRLKGGNFHAVILYYHEKNISPESLTALSSFVKRGGGVLALHSSMASFKRNKDYQTMLGGRFTGHGDIESINIYGKEKGNELLQGVDDLTVKDELYIHEYDESNRILLACDNKGKEEPIMWVKNYGSGRICYFAPGHCPAVYRNPQVRTIISNALEWVSDNPNSS